MWRVDIGFGELNFFFNVKTEEYPSLKTYWNNNNQLQCDISISSDVLLKMFGGEWIHVYVWLSPLLFTRNYQNIVNQLWKWKC